MENMYKVLSEITWKISSDWNNYLQVLQYFIINMRMTVGVHIITDEMSDIFRHFHSYIKKIISSVFEVINISQYILFKFTIYYALKPEMHLS